jgi:hypothetical protein
VEGLEEEELQERQEKAAAAAARRLVWQERMEERARVKEEKEERGQAKVEAREQRQADRKERKLKRRRSRAVFDDAVRGGGHARMGGKQRRYHKEPETLELLRSALGRHFLFDKMEEEVRFIYTC